MDPRKPEICFGASYVPYLLPIAFTCEAPFIAGSPLTMRYDSETGAFRLQYVESLAGAGRGVSFCMSSISDCMLRCYPASLYQVHSFRSIAIQRIMVLPSFSLLRSLKQRPATWSPVSSSMRDSAANNLCTYFIYWRAGTAFFGHPPTPS